MNTQHIDAFIGLGSNLGDRLTRLSEAAKLLEQRLPIFACERSRIYETDPVGPVTDQPTFLNAVMRITTDASPQTVLRTCLQIEHDLGRVRRETGGPRTIDLDLLLYGDQTHRNEDLQLPHPRLHLRRFVLAPLAELAPRHMHPTLGCDVATLLAALPEDGPPVRLTAHAW